MAHKFRELTVWHRAMELVTRVYTLTHNFPSHELYGLVSQLRRAAISIPLNIAEGQAAAARLNLRVSSKSHSSRPTKQ